MEFRILNNFLLRKNFISNNVARGRLAFQVFRDSRLPGFYITMQNNMPLKWQQFDDNLAPKFHGQITFLLSENGETESLFQSHKLITIFTSLHWKPQFECAFDMVGSKPYAQSHLGFRR